MRYRFTESLVGPDVDYRPGQVIEGNEFTAETITRMVDRGVLVAVEEEISRRPKVQKAVSSSSEKAIL